MSDTTPSERSLGMSDAIEVVAEGHTSPVQTMYYTKGWVGGVSVMRLAPADVDRRNAIPVLIVRNTPEARRRLGMEAGDE